MNEFWFGAGVLSAVALAFLLFPVWRQRKSTGRWSISALIAAGVTVPVAVALYLNVTTWRPDLLQQRAEETRLVAQLAERMAQQPDDVEGWRLLGRSYVMLGQYGEARKAFEEAWKRTPDPDNTLKLSLAEAQVLEDRSTLSGEAGQRIEEVLANEPDNLKALWYGGQRAYELGQQSVARQRLSHLLELNIQLPEQIKQIITMQLAQLQETDGAQSTAAADTAQAAADGPTIRLSVRLGEGISTEDLSPQAALFIFARDPAGGPPIAVIRRPASAVPGEFVLSDANTMLPGRSLADFPELNLVARLSPSGQPLERAGDLYAEQLYRAGEDGAVELVIDQTVQ